MKRDNIKNVIIEVEDGYKYSIIGENEYVCLSIHSKRSYATEKGCKLALTSFKKRFAI